MSRILTAAAIVATGALSAGLVYSTADAATAPYRPATLAYYANVDAEGHLGSHYGALRVTVDSRSLYTVTFKADITHCAAVAQAGKAGGPDPVKPAFSRVANHGSHAFIAGFADTNDNPVAEPFMMTVTCVR